MKEDPIVEEVREIRGKIWEECGGDMEKLMERLKKAQEQHRDRLVTMDDVRRIKGRELESKNAAARRCR